MRVEVILTAAGRGERMKTRKPKALLPLAGQPLFLHALKVFVQHRGVHKIVMTVPPGKKSVFMRWIRKLGGRIPVQVIEGGKTRSLSVRKAVEVLDSRTDRVLIHDAARPFVTRRIIDQVLTGLKKDSAVIVAVPAKSTIKRVDPATGYVAATLDRRVLWEVQTPQGFHRDVLIQAHADSQNVEATDDAMLIEQQGGRVRVLPGDERNMKVTTPDDVDIARAILATRRKGKTR